MSAQHQYARNKRRIPGPQDAAGAVQPRAQARHGCVCDRREGAEPELGDALRWNPRAAVLLRARSGRWSPT